MASARTGSLVTLVVLLLGAVAASADEPLPKKLAALESKRLATPLAAAERLRLTRATRRRIGAPAPPIITVTNLWTHETVVLDPRARVPIDQATWDAFLRCHHTNESRPVDPRLAAAVVRVARKFGKRHVEVISGFRAPKYQLVLLKKGREVARESQHMLGHALDFRVPGVPTRALHAFVRSLGVGGVGLYPDSGFVHLDTGPVRSWTGH